MAKLVIDEAAQKLLLSKVSNQPVFTGPNGKLISSATIDFVDHSNDNWHLWQPGDERTCLLLLCEEACRDLLFHSKRFSEAAHQKRVMRAMTVPLCTLMDKLQKLTRLLDDSEFIQQRESWSQYNQDTYREVGRRFRKKHLAGSVRKTRNKVAAHLDPSIIHDSESCFISEDFFAALGDSLILFNLVTNYNHTFSWIRWIASSDDESLHVVETLFQYPVCVQWVTDQEGKAIDVGTLQLSEDPLLKIQETAKEAVAMYNTMAEQSETKKPQIWIY